VRFGFRLLGAKASPAVPALARWLNDDEDSVRADAGDLPRPKSDLRHRGRCPP